MRQRRKLREWKAVCPKCDHIEMSEETGATCENCDSPAEITYAYHTTKEEYFASEEAKYSYRALTCTKKCGWSLNSLNCSKCGAEIKGRFFKGKEIRTIYCFVATSAFNDIHHPIVEELRCYRDEVLAKTITGRKFIYYYYKHGWRLANILDRLSFLKPGVRYFLSLCVRLKK